MLSSDSGRSTVGIVHPQLIPRGGSEARALWLAEALKDNYIVSLISMGRIDLERLNDYYGTHLNYSDIRTIEIPIPNIAQSRFDALRGYRLARYCRENAHQFDALISSYNVMDFGMRGIQFIADFSFNDHLRRRLDVSMAGPAGLLYKKSIFRSLYLGLANRLAGQTQKGWLGNMTVSNSHWTSEIMGEAYGLSSQIIYPPVHCKFPVVEWGERENGFIALGSITLAKRFERIIGILKRVRENGFKTHLHIVGGDSQSTYSKIIRDLANKNSQWVFLEGKLSGQAKLQIIAHHRYGISGRQNEPFGIAVAEMVRAGCLVWVPCGGGQMEIVEHPALIFKDEDEALAKITEVLKSESLQQVLKQYLSQKADMFSEEKFMNEGRELVRQFINVEHCGPKRYCEIGS